MYHVFTTKDLGHVVIAAETIEQAEADLKHYGIDEYLTRVSCGHPVRIVGDTFVFGFRPAAEPDDDQRKEAALIAAWTDEPDTCPNCGDNRFFTDDPAYIGDGEAASSGECDRCGFELTETLNRSSGEICAPGSPCCGEDDDCGECVRCEDQARR